MEETYYPKKGWQICCAEQADGSVLDAQELSVTGGEGKAIVWYPSPIPTSVQDVLRRNGEIPAQAWSGTADLDWVAERDWIYLARFSLPAERTGSPAVLHLLGIDTVAEFYLNGMGIGSHEDMYLRKSIPVSGLLRRENILAIRFRSPKKEAARLAGSMPEAWKGVIEPARLLRKALSDSATFLGNRRPCACIGLYDEVFLTLLEPEGWIEAAEVRCHVSEDLAEASLEGTVEVVCRPEKAYRIHVSVTGPDGSAAGETDCRVEHGAAPFGIVLREPMLWWPSHYGPQNLYTVKAELFLDGRRLSAMEKRVGIRKVEYAGDFRYTVNNRQIRLWGSNFVNVDGLTHWCDRERLQRLMEWARDGNLNILRVWGEAPLLPDCFYALADEMGLLIWQDFGLGFGPWPDDKRYRALFREEVRQMVLRLRHHPSILFWCGSNETYMAGVSGFQDGAPLYGFDLIFRDAPEICSRLDPGRPYLPSSPMGGNYPQDAAAGDIHGYWGNDFEPGIEYPVLFSESCHATTYCKHSMLRFMTEEEIWPKGYADMHLHDPHFFAEAARKGQSGKSSYALCFQNYWRQISVPDSWRPHLSEFASSELWGLENYFDAHDVDSILYKYTVCGADFYKREIERVRRGRPCGMPFARRICNGYLTWKFNDAWPHINFTQVDYFLEPTAQYYAVKRAYAPVLAGVSAERDHLYLWAVNDTAEACRGEIRLRVFSRLRNCVERDYQFPVWLRPDESKVIDCLDWMGPIHREQILHTEFRAQDGSLYGTNICYLDQERNLSFPSPNISLSWENGLLAVRTDQFARYIELTGAGEGGDAFGWRFSDNYFDLLPFETRYVQVLCPYARGTITASPHYGEPSAPIHFPPEE